MGFHEIAQIKILEPLYSSHMMGMDEDRHVQIFQSLINGPEGFIS
jgi:hypothetical protein